MRDEETTLLCTTLACEKRLSFLLPFFFVIHIFNILSRCAAAPAQLRRYLTLSDKPMPVGKAVAKTKQIGEYEAIITRFSSHCVSKHLCPRSQPVVIYCVQNISSNDVDSNLALILLSRFFYS